MQVFVSRLDQLVNYMDEKLSGKNSYSEQVCLLSTKHLTSSLLKTVNRYDLFNKFMAIFYIRVYYLRSIKIMKQFYPDFKR